MSLTLSPFDRELTSSSNSSFARPLSSSRTSSIVTSPSDGSRRTACTKRSAPPHRLANREAEALGGREQKEDMLSCFAAMKYPRIVVEEGTTPQEARWLAGELFAWAQKQEDKPVLYISSFQHLQSLRFPSKEGAPGKLQQIVEQGGTLLFDFRGFDSLSIPTLNTLFDPENPSLEVILPQEHQSDEANPTPKRTAIALSAQTRVMMILEETSIRKGFMSSAELGRTDGEAKASELLGLNKQREQFHQWVQEVHTLPFSEEEKAPEALFLSSQLPWQHELEKPGEKGEPSVHDRLCQGESFVIENAPLEDPAFLVWLRECFEQAKKTVSPSLELSTPHLFLLNPEEKEAWSPQSISHISYPTSSDWDAVINLSTFDELLEHWDFNQEGKLEKHEGLVAEKAGESLHLLITKPLADRQWRSLFRQAAQSSTSLRLTCLKGCLPRRPFGQARSIKLQWEQLTSSPQRAWTSAWEILKEKQPVCLIRAQDPSKILEKIKGEAELEVHAVEIFRISQSEPDEVLLKGTVQRLKKEVQEPFPYQMQREAVGILKALEEGKSVVVIGLEDNKALLQDLEPLLYTGTFTKGNFCLDLNAQETSGRLICLLDHAKAPTQVLPPLYLEESTASIGRLLQPYESYLKRRFPWPPSQQTLKFFRDRWQAAPPHLNREQKITQAVEEVWLAAFPLTKGELSTELSFSHEEKEETSSQKALLQWLAINFQPPLSSSPPTTRAAFFVGKPGSGKSSGVATFCHEGGHAHQILAIGASTPVSSIRHALVEWLETSPQEGKWVVLNIEEMNLREQWPELNGLLAGETVVLEGKCYCLEHYPHHIIFATGNDFHLPGRFLSPVIQSYFVKKRPQLPSDQELIDNILLPCFEKIPCSPSEREALAFSLLHLHRRVELRVGPGVEVTPRELLALNQLLLTTFSSSLEVSGFQDNPTISLRARAAWAIKKVYEPLLAPDKRLGFQIELREFFDYDALAPVNQARHEHQVQWLKQRGWIPTQAACTLLDVLEIFAAVNASSSNSGKKGLWIEGSSGIGKDSITRRFFEEQLAASGRLLRHRNAMGHMEELFKDICECLQADGIYILSEANLLISEDLEALNAFLASYKGKGGLILTCNSSSGYANRNDASSALLSRLLPVYLPSLDYEELLSFSQHVMAKKRTQQGLSSFPRLSLLAQRLVSEYEERNTRLGDSHLRLEVRHLVKVCHKACELLAANPSLGEAKHLDNLVTQAIRFPFSQSAYGLPSSQLLLQKNLSSQAKADAHPQATSWMRWMSLDQVPQINTSTGAPPWGQASLRGSIEVHPHFDRWAQATLHTQLREDIPDEVRQECQSLTAQWHLCHWVVFRHLHSPWLKQWLALLQDSQGQATFPLRYQVPLGSHTSLQELLTLLSQEEEASLQPSMPQIYEEEKEALAQTQPSNITRLLTTLKKKFTRSSSSNQEVGSSVIKTSLPSSSSSTTTLSIIPKKIQRGTTSGFGKGQPIPRGQCDPLFNGKFLPREVEIFLQDSDSEVTLYSFQDYFQEEKIEPSDSSLSGNVQLSPRGGSNTAISLPLLPGYEIQNVRLLGEATTSSPILLEKDESLGYVRFSGLARPIAYTLQGDGIAGPLRLRDGMVLPLLSPLFPEVADSEDAYDLKKEKKWIQDHFPQSPYTSEKLQVFAQALAGHKKYASDGSQGRKAREQFDQTVQKYGYFTALLLQKEFQCAEAADLLIFILSSHGIPCVKVQGFQVKRGLLFPHSKVLAQVPSQEGFPHYIELDATPSLPSTQSLSSSPLPFHMRSHVETAQEVIQQRLETLGARYERFSTTWVAGSTGIGRPDPIALHAGFFAPMQPTGAVETILQPIVFPLHSLDPNDFIETEGEEKKDKVSAWRFTLETLLQTTPLWIEKSQGSFISIPQGNTEALYAALKDLSQDEEISSSSLFPPSQSYWFLTELLTSLVDEVAHCLAPPLVPMPEVLNGFLEKNDFAAAHSYLKENPQYLNSTYITFKYDFTPLTEVSMKGNIDAIKKLLELGVNINSHTAKTGQTALIGASRLGYKKAVHYLLQQGALIDAQNKQGSSPLIQAILENDLSIASFLLEQGASIDIQDSDGDSALMNAVLKNEIKMTQLLLEYQPNIHLRNKDGKSALEIARSNLSKYQNATALKKRASTIVELLEAAGAQ